MLQIQTVESPRYVQEAQQLFREYEQGLGVSLCFQNFEEELRRLPGDYAEPHGALLIGHFDGEVAGCCALRRATKGPYQNAAELKRLFVRPDFRGRGVARKLVMEILRRAKDKGYEVILLDTLKSMTEAQALYVALGFEEIPAYYPNPEAGTKYMKLDLRDAQLFQ